MQRNRVCSHFIEYLGESQQINKLSILNQIYWKCYTQGKLLVCNWNEELEMFRNYMQYFKVNGLLFHE